MILKLLYGWWTHVSVALVGAVLLAVGIGRELILMEAIGLVLYLIALGTLGFLSK